MIHPEIYVSAHQSLNICLKIHYYGTQKHLRMKIIPRDSSPRGYQPAAHFEPKTHDGKSFFTYVILAEGLLESGLSED